MFQKFACHFSIRARLKTFLLLPWLIILCFGLNHTSDYLEDIKLSRKAILSIEISSEIDDLIYELQKERGLSAGVFDRSSKKKLVQLQKQRLQTDLRIEHTIGFIQRIELTQLELNTIASQQVINDVLKDIFLNIEGLSQARSKIDDYDSQKIGRAHV